MMLHDFVACLGSFLKEYDGAITAVATVFLMFITGGLVWVGYRQIHTTRAQLRAYIFVDGGSFELIRTNKNRQFIHGNITVKNFGATPAYEFSICTRMDIFDIKSPPFSEDLNGRGKSVIGPSAGRNITVTKGPINDVDLALIRTGTKSIFIWGRIDYVDAFKKRRYLMFYNMNGREILVQGDTPSGRWPIDQADKPYKGN